MRLGVHVSIAGSIDQAVDRAIALGCNTFQIFTRSTRSWSFKELDPEEVILFKKKVKASGIKPVFSHMPYLPNLASPDQRTHQRAVKHLLIEMDRCHKLGIPYIVTHLGSHMGSGSVKGIAQVVLSLNQAIGSVSSNNKVKILLENSSGSRNGVGSIFEDIRAIIDQVVHRRRLGVCFDTCHAFVAGYDLRTRQVVNATMELFNSIIGLKWLKLLHLNDSKGGFGSSLDRHEHIGLGKIGYKGFRAIVNHDQLKHLPLIMETPVDDRRGDEENIRKMRNLALSK